MSQYWIYRWLDECGIQSQWEITNALNRPGAFKRLARLQEAAAAKADAQLSPTPRSVVAGRSLDLSGNVACGGYDCLQRDIDIAFLQMWHYFDGIVVAALHPTVVHDAVSDTAEGDLDKERVRNHIRIVLYMRSIGAESWVAFANKDRKLSDQDWSSLARSLSVQDAFEGQRHEQIVKNIAKNTRFNVQRTGSDQWTVDISGGYFRNKFTTYVHQEARPAVEDLARRLLRNYGTAAIADVAAAQELTLPLVQPTSVPWISSKKSKPTQEEVALQLRLPVLTNLTVTDFLKIREDERPAFEEFRKGLRDQIKSQIDSAVGGESAKRIARNVEDDYLRPGLAEIEQRLRGSRKAMIKKSAVSLGIGTSVATIGAMSSVPMMIAGSVIALGSAVPLAPLIGSYIDETTKEIPMDKLYFLWRLNKKGKHWTKHR